MNKPNKGNCWGIKVICHGTAAPRHISAEQLRRHADYLGSSSVCVCLSLPHVNERETDLTLDHSNGYLKKTEVNLHIALYLLNAHEAHICAPCVRHKTGLFSPTITGSTRQSQLIIIGSLYTGKTQQAENQFKDFKSLTLLFLQCTCTR